jgi:nudix motif 8
VVGFLGELSDQQLRPNPDEVSECFTIPIHLLLDQSMWVHDEANGTVAFLGGPHVIWGLTAYILDRFLSETVRRYEIADGSGAIEGSGEVQTHKPL